MLFHGSLLLALVWRGAVLLGGGGAGPGPRGGGGGGGAVHYMTLPAPAAPRAFDVPAPRVTVPELPVPDPVAIKLPALETQAVTPPAATATGAGTGPGSGPGTGGGQGTGTGPGTGSDAGPGTGGDGSYIFRADPILSIFPPVCARGHFTVQFWVEVDGHVSRIEVDPLPKDGGCRREFVEKMKGYQFRPAHTRDGRAVASVYPIQISR